MGCLFALMAGVFPRFALLILWIARPKFVDEAFDGWFWPLLGIIFLPFATLMYVVLHTGGGLHGFDWGWIIFAGILDIVHWGAGWTQRRQAPGYPGTVQI
ncbi:hypothetical protein [Kribbella soli]|uniref:Uncharacterized protein n=1 Tax=Kribbella soli TaxID=1124743 RepID=A0A4R0HJ84_9ACTN|nr:hypothetical protein [Kribbella soli]TCC07829.1 hypothetical protein E0H45_17940 [Kribbella soli]